MSKKGLILSLFAVFVLMLQVASAQDAVKKQQQKIDSYRKDLALIEKKLKENEAKKGSAISKLDLVRASVRARKALVAQSDVEISAFEDSIRTMNNQIAVLQTRLDTLETYYARLVRNAYKNRDAKVWYMFILSSENLGQAFRRIGVLKSLSAQMSAQAKKITATKEEMAVQKEQLEGLKKQAEAVRAQRRAEVTSLQKDEREAENIVNTIQKNSKKYKKEADAKRAEIKRLNAELDKLRKEAEKLRNSKKKEAKKDASKLVADEALSNEFKRNKGKLPWPAAGPVLSSFGSYRHPLHRNVTDLKNNGVNISVSAGDQIKSIFNGTVMKTFVLPGYGHAVAVSHGDYITLYCRLTEVSVKEGQKVTTGQTLGKAGPVQGDTYLHFELWDPSNKAVDPESWLK